MEVEPDFRDLLKLFNEHRVKYIIVGAYALAYHGVPRYTGDIDILVRPDRENAKSIVSALDEFGFGSVGLTAEEFTAPDRVVQLGFAPVRVGIITSITGVSWEEAETGQETGVYGDVPVYYIGKTQLIKNKRTLARKKDMADLEALGEE